MKKSRFTESQIVAILKEGEAGVAVAQLTRKHGISAATYYHWKSKYGGADVSELKRLRELEAENAKSKRMYGRSGAGKHGDQERSQPKTLTPSAKREAVCIMTQEHGLPIVRACQAARLSQAAYYRPGIDVMSRDAEVIAALQAVVAEEQRWGFWKCHHRLRAQGHAWNHTRIWRVYCQLRLNLPRRTKRRVPPRDLQPLTVEPRINAAWALDFMRDTLSSRRSGSSGITKSDHTTRWITCHQHVTESTCSRRKLQLRTVYWTGKLTI